MHFVFCHGLGFETQFWEPIAPYFSQERCSFIDLGYFNNPSDNQHLREQRIIGIGHSIGLSKLISIHEKFDCLIGLNSFTNFLGSDQAIYQKRQKELKALRSSFLRDPDSALRNLYRRSGSAELIKSIDFSKLNLNLMMSDLESLQKEYKLPEVATLILSSDDDILVPDIITSDNFSKERNVKIKMIMNGGHALGFKKPSEVYEKIMSFLDDCRA